MSALPGPGPAADRDVAWTRGEGLALAALVAGGLAALPFLAHPWYDPTDDGAMYLATARSLAAGEGYTLLGLPFRIRPPGTSLLLAPLLAWRGTDFLAVNVLMGLFGVAAAALAFAFFRPRLGATLSSLAAVAIFLNPGFRTLSNQPMSDVPGLALLFGCLLLERRAAAAPSARRDFVLGLAIGGAALVRSVSLLLVPALWLCRLVERAEAAQRPPLGRFALQRLLPAALGASLVLAPWLARNAIVELPAPVDQTLHYSYGTAMWRVDGGDPGSALLSVSAILARAPVRGEQLLRALGARLHGASAGASPLALGALLALFGLAEVVRRRAAAEAFAAGALLVTLFYFDFTPRLALPLFALWLPATAEGLRDLAGRFVGVRAATALAALPLCALLAVDTDPQGGWRRIQRNHEGLLAAARQIGAQLEPDVRLAAPRGFHYAVVLDRPVHSLAFAVRRAGRPEAAEAVFDRYDIDAVVVWRRLSGDRPLLRYLARRYAVAPGRAPQVVRVRERTQP